MEIKTLLRHKDKPLAYASSGL